MTKLVKNIFLVLAAVLFCACHNAPEVQVSVRECAPLPEVRVSARACVLEGKAYVFGGRDAEKKARKELWQYDPAADSWTQINSFPDTGRVNAAITACGDRLFMGLGFAGRVYVESCYLRDWWSYTPATNEWKRLADFPNMNTVAPVVVSDGTAVYALFGCGRFQQCRVWQYSIAEDKWAELPLREIKPAAFGCAGAMCGGQLYFGLGFDAHNWRDWFSVTLPENEWKACRSIPGKGREFSACAANNQYVYIFGGQYFGGNGTGGEIFESFMRYAPAKDQWEWCGTMPGGRAVNQIAFSIDGKVYFGLGEDENSKGLNTIYCIDE